MHGCPTPLAAIALSCALAAPAAAIDWPTKQVRIVVPMPAGGGPDTAARLFGNALAKRWGQPVVIENRPGADASTGTGAFARGSDDHALLYGIASALTVNPIVQKQVPFDPKVDFVPISAVANAILVVAVHRKVPAETLADLLEVVRANQGKMLWGSGPSLPRYAFNALLRRNKAEMRHVAYRDLATPQADLGEGRIQVLVTSLAASHAPVKQGKARILAITNSARASSLPDVPTAEEAGHPEMSIDGLSGFFGRSGMSTELRDKISADIQDVGRDAEIRRPIEASGQIVMTGGPAQFEAAINRQRQRVNEIARLIDLASTK